MLLSRTFFSLTSEMYLACCDLHIQTLETKHKELSLHFPSVFISSQVCSLQSTFRTDWNSNMAYMPQIFHFPDQLFCIGVYEIQRMIGLKCNTKTCQQIVKRHAFHVNMLRQLHLPVNSIICNHKKIRSKTFETISYSQ